MPGVVVQELTQILQPESAPRVNATLVLRAIASARAFCKPFWIDSAAVRILVLSIMVWKLGIAIDASIARTATPIISSSSENPECFEHKNLDAGTLDFGYVFSTFPPW